MMKRFVDLLVGDIFSYKNALFVFDGEYSCGALCLKDSFTVKKYEKGKRFFFDSEDTVKIIEL